MASRYPRAGASASSALLDQAQAATSDAGRIVAFLAAREGGELRSGTVNGTSPTAVIVRRLQIRLIVGGVTMCPHVAGIAPVYWVAWAPGRLRCVQCVEASARRIRGTAEDNKCDCCRQTADRLHAVTIPLPAIVFDLPRPAALPPVIVRLGLCPTCNGGDVG